MRPHVSIDPPLARVAASVSDAGDTVADCTGPGCGSRLVLYLPDEDRPLALFGACPGCGRWFRVTVEAHRI